MVASGSQSKAVPQDDEEENLCAICYDKPVTYGLLTDCSHVFCISCIKNWRENEGKSEDIIQAGTTKTCPMCRTPSRFVTPSTHFYPEGHPKKAEVIDKYKASMARVKCRYFEQSKPNRRYCPFGKDCFYKHENADGTPYVFEHGASYYMNRTPSRRRRDDVDFELWDAESETEFEVMLSTISQVFGGSQDLRTALRAVASAFAADFPRLSYEETEEDNDEDQDGEDSGVEEPAMSSISLASVIGSNAEDDQIPASGIEIDDEVVIAPDSVPEDGDTTPELISNEEDATSPSVAFALDPTIPEFIPSFQLSLGPLRRPASPSYRHDMLRPLPHGPTLPAHDERASETEPEATDPPFGAPWLLQGSLRELEDIFDPVREQSEAVVEAHSQLDLTSVLLTSPPPPPAVDSPSVTSSAIVTDAVPLAPSYPPQASPTGAVQADTTAAIVHDSDPPFMTDGRGRVVWSSTTSSRGREGRRGRAASSSATVHPHVKANAEMLAADDGRETPSCHGSPMHHSSGLPHQHLVRQRSLPSVSIGTSTEEKRTADFVTDGRGRVVFASNNRSY
ncbi:hypothetical protein ACG7TL_005702 [Trametes sanguinea]